MQRGGGWEIHWNYNICEVQFPGSQTHTQMVVIFAFHTRINALNILVKSNALNVTQILINTISKNNIFTKIIQT